MANEADTTIVVGVAAVRREDGNWDIGLDHEYVTDEAMREAVEHFNAKSVEWKHKAHAAIVSEMAKDLAATERQLALYGHYLVVHTEEDRRVIDQFRITSISLVPQNRQVTDGN